MLFCCGGSGLVDADVAFLAHLDGELQLLAAHYLRALNRQDARFDSEFLEGVFHFLDQSLLHLSLWIDHLPDQAFTELADALGRCGVLISAICRDLTRWLHSEGSR